MPIVIINSSDKGTSGAKHAILKTPMGTFLTNEQFGKILAYEIIHLTSEHWLITNACAFSWRMIFIMQTITQIGAALRNAWTQIKYDVYIKTLTIIRKARDLIDVGTSILTSESGKIVIEPYLVTIIFFLIVFILHLLGYNSMIELFS